MNRIPTIAPLLATSFVAGSSLLSPAIAAEPQTKPNVLFIAIDDLRPDLGCYGNTLIKSPNINSIAKNGMVFNRAYCQQAVCSPSRTSMLTGLRPDTTKVWNLTTHFRKAVPEVITLPQHFKDNGYFTQALGKIYHSGLDDTPSWSVPSANPRSPFGAERKAGREGRGPAFEATDKPENALFDGELGDMAVTALRGMKEKAKPFFLAVGFIRPHLPFIAPRKYWEMYDPAKIPLAPNPFAPIGAPAYSVGPGGELHSYDQVPKGRHIPDDFARQLKHGYFASISFVDAQVGRLLNELEQQGLRENTIIVIWGDHGWKLGEHDAWAKHTNVEDDTRTPLVISVPGMNNAGKTTPALVEFVDIYPTLSEVAGLPKPKMSEGLSFKPLLDNQERAWKTAAFSQFPRDVGRKKMMGYTMRTERYRLTNWVDRADVTKVNDVELYDHQTDPQENTNIANDPANKTLVASLTAQWRAGWQGSLPK